ncbi:hypothetical protein ACFQPA_11120 [Halomarina halobia]|uniref:Halobacterial output domain-containing protein n=1 Tax=Halomarina halobia TaxID=3033386 RepID=A0ABD6AAD9_9EURY|nr:hypothetical protein [Halomarina sp. PSR21]
MVVSTDSIWEFLADLFEEEYADVTVYGDADERTVLHEGPVRVRANGWIELPAGRLLSPGTVHHVDVHSSGSPDDGVDRP